MRKFSIPLITLSVLIISAGISNAGIDIGLSADKDGVKSFYLAIGEHYVTYDKEIQTIRKLNIPDEELPLVFFLAGRAGVSKNEIIELRLRGNSWMDICLHFGLTAEIFYVPVKGNPGPPYGKAYGHFKNKNKKDWKNIRLSDAEIINFVNLKFLSEHYGYSPDEIIQMRSKGKSFIDINSDVKKMKAQKKDNSLVQSKEKKKNGKKKK